MLLQKEMDGCKQKIYQINGFAHEGSKRVWRFDAFSHQRTQKINV
jgi:hypothetical protein